MKMYKTQIDKNGRILIPTSLRKKHHMNIGDGFILQSSEGCIKILNIDYAVDEMNEIFCKHTPTTDRAVVDEFIDKKKEELIIEQTRGHKND